MKSNSIGKNLIYQRKLKGLTQEQLSESSQVTVRTIQRIEKGDVNPHLQTVKLLADALDIEVSDLLILENPKEENIQKKWLLLLHSTPFIGFIIPFFNVLLPLFLWIHKREDNNVYDIHGRRVVNFQISMTMLYLLSFIALVTIEKWGFFFFIAVIPFGILIMIINIIKVTNSQKCFYPLAFPFLGKKNKNQSSTLLSMSTIVMLFLVSCNNMNIDTIERLDGTHISKDSLTNKINQLVKDAQVHGMAVTVFNNNVPVYQNTFGYKNYPKKLALTDSTSIYGASLSKAIFSVLVMSLVEDGIIDLDTPLESYLPKKIYEYKPETRWHDDYSALKTDSLYHKITARMCLAHTSGFDNWRTAEKDIQVFQEPGTKHIYSGEGFVYLQVVLEKITGKGLQQLANERVFKPLKMNNSAYLWKPEFESDFAFGHDQKGNAYEKDIDNEPRSASTLETTALDYAKFIQGILNKNLISEESYNEIFSLQTKVTSPTSSYKGLLNRKILFEDTEVGYGLGWGHINTPYGIAVFKGGNGSGFQHYSVLFPEKNMGVLIMTNSRNGRGIFIELLRAALKDTFSTLEVAILYSLKSEYIVC